jgi:predicted metal-dependent phosphoesterase TrpH
VIHRTAPPGAIADLHLHTTASDGRSTPAELVEQIAAAGLQVMAVTDHDTTAAVRETQELARQKGIELIPGIEITASEDGRDVHVLGYFIDPDHAGLNGLLETARTSRIARLRGIAERLNALGLPVDVDAILASAGPATGRSAGRSSPGRWSPPVMSGAPARRSTAGWARRAPPSCRARR